MCSMDFTTPVNPAAKIVEGCIPVEDIKLIDYDREKAASQRTEVLEIWSKNVK